MSLVAMTVASVASVALLSAQGDGLPAFEVASIKPQVGKAVYGPDSPDRFTHPDATLVALIRFAYNVQDFQVIGGPGWVTSSRFDVSAKAAAPPPSQDQMRLMVRRLLIERFGLRTHVETRQLPTYALVRARPEGSPGVRLRPSTVDCTAILAAPGGSSRLGRTADGAFAPCSWRIGITPAVATMLLDGAPLSHFANLLQSLVKRVVIDETGLGGTYDIQLEFAPEQTGVPLPPSPGGPAPPPRDGLSIFTALDDQLGLKLESRRGPVEIIVIDHAETPTAD